ncbi:unnamed protein product, partial [Dovyalis caffra]
GIKVKDDGINEFVNEGIIECDVDAIKMLYKSDDLTIDFLGVDNLYSRRSSSLKLTFDDIGYKIFEYVNWVVSHLNDDWGREGEEERRRESERGRNKEN